MTPAIALALLLAAEPPTPVCKPDLSKLECDLTIAGMRDEARADACERREATCFRRLKEHQTSPVITLKAPPQAPPEGLPGWAIGLIVAGGVLALAGAFASGIYVGISLPP